MLSTKCLCHSPGTKCRRLQFSGGWRFGAGGAFLCGLAAGGMDGHLLRAAEHLAIPPADCAVPFVFFVFFFPLSPLMENLIV